MEVPVEEGHVDSTKLVHGYQTSDRGVAFSSEFSFHILEARGCISQHCDRVMFRMVTRRQKVDTGSCLSCMRPSIDKTEVFYV